MRTYYVRDSYNDDNEWGSVEACDPTEAAEKYAEAIWANCDYPKRQTIEVRDGHLGVLKFSVEHETVPVFHARRIDESL